jgi:hypothetical protein
MRQHDRIDRGRLDREFGPVPLPQLAQTLEQAAIEQDPTATGLEQELRARDRAGGAKEREIHRPRSGASWW